MVNYQKSTQVSIVCATLLLPATILASKIIEYVLKSMNPSGVNIYNELAYLYPILVTSIAFYTVIFCVGVISGIYGLKGTSKQFAKLSIVLLFAQIVMAVISLLLQRATTSL